MLKGLTTKWVIRDKPLNECLQDSEKNNHRINAYRTIRWMIAYRTNQWIIDFIGLIPSFCLPNYGRFVETVILSKFCEKLFVPFLFVFELPPFPALSPTRNKKCGFAWQNDVSCWLCCRLNRSAPDFGPNDSSQHDKETRYDWPWLSLR